MVNDFPMSGMCCVASADPSGIDAYNPMRIPQAVRYQSLKFDTPAKKRVPLVEPEVEESWLSRLISKFQVVKKI